MLNGWLLTTVLGAHFVVQPHRLFVIFEDHLSVLLSYVDVYMSLSIWAFERVDVHAAEAFFLFSVTLRKTSLGFWVSLDMIWFLKVLWEHKLTLGLTIELLTTFKFINVLVQVDGSVFQIIKLVFDFVLFVRLMARVFPEDVQSNYNWRHALEIPSDGPNIRVIVSTSTICVNVVILKFPCSIVDWTTDKLCKDHSIYLRKRI